MMLALGELHSVDYIIICTIGILGSSGQYSEHILM